MDGYTKAPNHLILDASLSDGALRQYLVLRHHGRNGRCFPSIETLATEQGVSTDTVERRNQELERASLIVKHRGGFGKANVYSFPHQYPH